LDALEWCLDLGVRTVSVFAFSVDNFARPAAEVASLMALAQVKLASLLGDADLVARHGVRLRVVGDAGLLPAGVAAAAARAEAATAAATGPTLNVCLAYASRHELAAAVGRLGAEAAADAAARPPSPARGGGGRGAPPSPSSLPSLDGALYTAGCPPVDLLLRTSGESRLSDFLLWQAKDAHLSFCSRLWPALSFGDLARAVVAYQRAAPPHATRRAAGGGDRAAWRAGAGGLFDSETGAAGSLADVLAANGAPAGEARAGPPPPADAAPPLAAAPPPPPPGVPRRKRGARADPLACVPEWAARPAPPADDGDDGDDDATGRHRFDPQCVCCIAPRRGGANDGGDMPAGVREAMDRKKAREAAVRAAAAAARAARDE